MPQVDGSIRIGTEITTKQAEKELKQLESSIKQSASEISRLQKEMENVKTPTKQYESLQHAINTSKTELETFVEEQKRLSDKGIGKGIDKKYLAASETVKRLKSELQQAIEIGDKDAYLGIEDSLNRAKSVLQEMMSKNPRPLGDIAYYYSIDKKIEDLKNNISLTESEMEKLEESGKAFTLGEGSEEKAAKIKELTEQMAADTQRQSELQSALAAEEERLADIKANAAVSDQQIVELLERREQLTKEIADMESAGLGYGYREYDSAQQELSSINNQMREYKNNLATVPERFSHMYKSAQRAFNALGRGISKSGGLLSLLKNSADKTFQTVSEGAKQSTGLISTFARRLKGLAASAFIFNLISKGFSSMVSSMKTGFTNLMGYSNSFANSIQSIKNSLSTMGNQIAAAFAPIIQAVIPWLNQLISVLSVAMSYVSQFIAALTGKGTYIRAKKVQDAYGASLGGTTKKEEEVANNADDMSDALDDSAKSAKKVRGALAAFDDLDVLEKQDESTDAAADKIKDLNNQLKDLGSGAGGDMGDLFEEVPIEGSIFDAVEKLKDILAQLFTPLKEAWEREGEFVMDSWKYALKEIWQLIKDIGRDFLTMWNQDATVRMFADILHIVGDIGLVIGNIANALDEAWNENQTGLRILENIRDIFAVIIKNIREAADFTVEWSKTLDFSPLLESVEHLTRALVPFADFVSGTLADFYTEFLLPLASWTLSEDGIPRLINILGDFMDAVDWEALRTSLRNLYSALEPYAENVAEGLINFLEEVKNFGVDFLNSLPGPIQKLADALKSGDPEKVRSWATTLLEFIVSVKALKTAFEGFEIVKSGLALFGTGGMASTIASTAPEAAEGISLLATAFGYLTTTLSSLAAASVLIDPFLNDLGIAAGANGQQVDTLADRYDGLGGKINVVKDFLSLGSNAMEGFGLNASNTAGQIGALETVMNNIADGMIYTDSQLEKLRTRFGLTDEDIEMLRQSMLDTNEPLRQLADDFGLFDASVETLQGIQTGMKLLEDGTLSASEAFDEFSKPMWGMNDAALNFFQSISDGSISLDGYQSKLNETSQTVNEFSENMKEVGGNIAGGITQGFENADVETPVRGFFRSVLDSLSSVFDMHSPAKNMEPSGENIMLGVLEGFKNCFGMVKEVVSEFFQNMELSFSENLQNLQVFFIEAWSNLYESTVETWTLIQEYFTEFWKLFIESLTETWEEILLIFTENFEQVQLLFEDFITFLNEIFIVSWLEAWTLAGQQYQTFHDLLTMLTKAIQEMFTLFMKKIQELVNTMWKNAWNNAKNIFVEFKNNVEELSNNIREIIQSLFDFVMSLIAQMLAGLESVAAKAASLSSGGFSLGGGGGAAPAAASYSAQSFAAYTADLPHLASGSVLRGGNPFMAILNDQPRGQTNIEAPLSTIEQAVKNVINRQGYNRESVPVNINLNYDGETFARLSISDILSELARQGYDVDVLGVT